MKKALYLLPILLLAFGCNTKTTETTTGGQPDAAAAETQKPAAMPEVKLSCREIRGLDDEMPLSEVVLNIGDKKIPVDSCNACEEYAADAYSNFEIPSTAKSAVGGWWAGGGDYFYVAIEGDEAVVYVGYADEGSEEQDQYQYQEIHRAKIQ